MISELQSCSPACWGRAVLRLKWPPRPSTTRGRREAAAETGLGGLPLLSGGGWARAVPWAREVRGWPWGVRPLGRATRWDPWLDLHPEAQPGGSRPHFTRTTWADPQALPQFPAWAAVPAPAHRASEREIPQQGSGRPARAIWTSKQEGQTPRWSLTVWATGGGIEQKRKKS